MDDETQGAPAANAAETDPRAARIGDLVDQWMVDCIHGSPVSRDTDAVNHLIGALPELKRRILRETT